MQFMTMTFAASLQVIYIGLSRPFKATLMNRLELFNEYILLISCIFLFVFSDGMLIRQTDDPAFDEGISDEDTKH